MHIQRLKSIQGQWEDPVKFLVRHPLAKASGDVNALAEGCLTGNCCKDQKQLTYLEIDS
jgi:hypothetical protein